MQRLEPDSAIGRRLDARVRARLYAQLVTHEELQTVYIDSLSTRGAGLCVDTLPATGSEVVLSWQAHDLPGKIVWARGRRCGVLFVQPVPNEVVGAIVRTAGGTERYARDLGRSARPQGLG